MKFRQASGLISAAGLAVLLAACGDDPAPVLEEGEREASEEVLERTISDDMLPLDQVRSQAPLAEPEAAEDGEGGAAGEEGEASQASEETQANEETQVSESE